MLWQSLWLNVLSRNRFAKGFDSQNNAPKLEPFPWMRAAQTSEKNQLILPSASDQTVLYWGTPKRWWLDFTEVMHEANPAFALSLSKPLSTKHGAMFHPSKPKAELGADAAGRIPKLWRHPLSPTEARVDDGGLPLGVVHRVVSGGRIPYVEWIDLNSARSQKGKDETVTYEPAAILTIFRNEERYRALPRTARVRLWCFGFDAKQASINGFLSERLPCFVLRDVSRAAQTQFDDVCAKWVCCAESAHLYFNWAVVWGLRGGDKGRNTRDKKFASEIKKLQMALRRTKESDKTEKNPTSNADPYKSYSELSQAFWAASEADFYSGLSQIAAIPDWTGEEASNTRNNCGEMWLKTLREITLRLFQQYTGAVGDFATADIERVSRAYWFLDQKMRVSLPSWRAKAGLPTNDNTLTSTQSPRRSRTQKQASTNEE